MTVKVWFAASQARYLRERAWAERQDIEERPDGSVVLAMETSGRYDVKKWVLSYGADAELLEPEDLREEIREEVTALAQSYGRRRR